MRRIRVDTMIELPSRQVHLDFHTSEHIRGVGARFDERQFQRALKLARLNSITVFAKCHHGWSYYPTKVGARHPHLKTNLLARQIEAAHAIGVRAPIYYTVGWSVRDAEQHPEWVVRDRAGAMQAVNVDPNAKPNDPRPVCSWQFLDPAGGYKEMMLRQVEEVCRTLPTDGLFFDICHGPVSLAPERIQAMRGEGLDPENPADLEEFKTRVWTTFMREARELVQSHHAAATVFFNGVAGMEFDPRYHAQQTHFELEDLPTTWGGYDKFPPRAKFFAAAYPEKPRLAMSGKFHTMWGEFGGFKHADAIRFEAASMIAFGAACSFGDQLHPSGAVDLATYRNIGQAYEYVERIEEFGLGGGATPVSNLGVWLSTGESVKTHGVPTSAHDQGVANMLMESQIDFEVIPPGRHELDRFDTIILTGGAILGGADAKQLRAFLDQGGKLLVLGESALDRETRSKLVLDVGGRYLGPARFADDYTVIGRELSRGLVDSPFLNYEAAVRVKPTTGKVLARVCEPYFNRTYATYCSHQNTPYQLDPAPHAGALQQGNLIFLPHALGKLYYLHGARVHRDLFLNALRRLHRRPMLEVTGLPSAGRVHLIHQPNRRRYVVHLLYAPPLQRGRCLVIEDLPTVRDITVSLRVRGQVFRHVALPLARKRLTPRTRNGAIHVVIPEVTAHHIVVFSY